MRFSICQHVINNMQQGLCLWQVMRVYLGCFDLCAHSRDASHSKALRFQSKMFTFEMQVDVFCIWNLMCVQTEFFFLENQNICKYLLLLRILLSSPLTKHGMKHHCGAFWAPAWKYVSLNPPQTALKLPFTHLWIVSVVTPLLSFWTCDVFLVGCFCALYFHLFSHKWLPKWLSRTFFFLKDKWPYQHKGKV